MLNIHNIRVVIFGYFFGLVFTMFCQITYMSEYQLQVSAAQAAIED